MKVTGGIEENGIIVGNSFDKYGSRNFLIKRIMGGYKHSIQQLVSICEPARIFEIGCGEGHWVISFKKKGFNIKGCDISEYSLRLAKENALNEGVSTELFIKKDIYSLDKDLIHVDLVMCCEVLEHLEEPERSLQILQENIEKYLLVSVPREPIWRMLNMLRGSYLGCLGNTPGHVQHWSKKQFIQLIEKYFTIIEVSTPLPWTMILCRKR